MAESPGTTSLSLLAGARDDDQEAWRQLVTSSLDSGLVVASLSNGCEAWKELELCNSCLYQKERDIEKWPPQKQPGVLLRSADAGDLETLLDITFREVLSSTRPAASSGAS